MGSRPDWAELLQVVLLAEECNCAFADHEEVNRTFEQVIKDVAARIHRSATWSDRTVTLRYCREVNLARRPSQRVVDYFSSHLAAPANRARVGRSFGTPVALTGHLFIYTTGSGAKALATQPLPTHEPLDSRRNVRQIYFDEILNPLAIASDYLRKAAGESGDMINHLLQQWLIGVFRLPCDPRFRIVISDRVDHLNRLFFGSTAPALAGC